MIGSAFAPAPWQAILDAHQEYFEDADARMRMAFLPRFRAGEDGRACSVVQRQSTPVPMLAWEEEGGRIVAREGVFRGLDQLDADLLFVANDGALEDVLAYPEETALGEMKRKIRSGAIQIFVLRSREMLRELGYEDFMELLGLPFLGACR